MGDGILAKSGGLDSLNSLPGLGVAWAGPVQVQKEIQELVEANKEALRQWCKWSYCAWNSTLLDLHWSYWLWTHKHSGEWRSAASVFHRGAKAAKGGAKEDHGLTPEGGGPRTPYRSQDCLGPELGFVVTSFA